MWRRSSLPVAADNSVRATHSAAVGIVFATAYAGRSAPAAARPVAVDIAGRATDAVDTDLVSSPFRNLFRKLRCNLRQHGRAFGFHSIQHCRIQP